MKTVEEKAKAYDEAVERAKKVFNREANDREPGTSICEYIFPELATESEDEKTRKRIIALVNAHGQGMYKDDMLAWLEKQGSEPNWCHHKVDLSGCSEEYRKAYYDGWNNCNQQHSQCKSERNDVVKCLINGMKFYYEDNEEATWGTEKFSMRVKDILSWLEKQGEQKPATMSIDEAIEHCKEKSCGNNACALEHKQLEKWLTELKKLKEQKSSWSEEDEKMCQETIDWFEKKCFPYALENDNPARESIKWLKSIKNKVQPQNTWKPSDEQIGVIESLIENRSIQRRHLVSLYEQLKKLKGK